MKKYFQILLLIWFIKIRLCSESNAEENCLEFECRSAQHDAMSRCIPNTWRCDGWPDCWDGFDENHCKSSCPTHLFQCTSLTDAPHCVHNTSVCDGTIDCADASDEINNQCEHFFACEHLFRLTFLPISMKCDGFAKCENDERNCPCPPDRPNRCICNNMDNFTCMMMGYTCFADSERCDGKYDCVDRSDEWNCNFCSNAEFPLRCDFAKLANSSTCDDFTTEVLSPFVACFHSSERCDGKYDCSDKSDEWNCTNNCVGNSSNRCDCNKVDDFTCTGKPCFSESERCDAVYQCSDTSDEWNCTSCPANRPNTCDCNKYNDFTCQQQPCYNQSARCDGRRDCDDFSDEWNCTSCQNENYPFRCACNHLNNFTCKYLSSCYSERERCDGVNDCGDWSDELNCTKCPNNQHPCVCRTHGNITCTDDQSCYNDYDKCDLFEDCSDGSDEMNCVCPDGMFSCKCYTSSPATCDADAGCIPMAKVNDWRIDCEDKSDEPDYLVSVKTAQCGTCSLVIYRLNSTRMCDLIGFPTCDISTCTGIHDQHCGRSNCSQINVICTSHCPPENKTKQCDEFFQCRDLGIIFSHQFCDGRGDCDDGSDETINERGFRCRSSENSNGMCILPQANLYDETAQCDDSSDLCLVNNWSTGCFKCLDGRLNIALRQVCDGIIDCYDISDECLCNGNFDSPVCAEMFSQNAPNSLRCGEVDPKCSDTTSIYTSLAQCGSILGSCYISVCAGKYDKYVEYTWCDGRPECKYVQDECHCPDPPKFCNDPCRNYLQMNDRYCDGVNDPAWIYINDSRCPEGFDERDCPKRHYCQARDKISIDISRKCDGTTDCDDGSDENNCAQKSNNKIFSSDTEMIKSVPLRTAFWIMGVVSMTGNVYVILSTFKKIKKNKGGMAACNNILIMNLSLADLLMGFYLLIIAVKSAQYSGVYGKYDYEWRTSAACTGAGILAVISSETSCFLMTVLTSFRLFHVLKPIKSRAASSREWKVAVCMAWFVSVLLAVIPTFQATSNYFVHEMWTPDNPFSTTDGINKNDFTTFACRLASLTNSTIPTKDSIWDSTLAFINVNFPQFQPKGELGYYGETSVCMPRFYVRYGDYAWEYSMAIITINFISFIYVVVGYVVIYRRSFSHKIISTQNSDKSTKMQKRIARLIATDFCCWIPICILTYMKLGGVYLSSDVYVITAALLLPINSALNPMLYSPLIEKMLKNRSQALLQGKQRSARLAASYNTTETDRVEEICINELPTVDE